jgi:hypothetical protein
MVRQIYIDCMFKKNKSDEVLDKIDKEQKTAEFKDLNRRFFLFTTLYSNKKGGILLPPFLPQIYHKLNLLMLW